MSEWHCSINNTRYGPISKDQLLSWIAEGRVSSSELIAGKVVRLEFAAPKRPGAAYKRDHFGRLLARVFVDDVDVSGALTSALPVGQVSPSRGSRPRP